MFEIPGLTFLPRSHEDIYRDCKASPTAFNNWFHAVQALNVRAPKTDSIDLGIEIQTDIMNGVELSEVCELLGAKATELPVKQLLAQPKLSFLTEHGLR